MPKINLSQKDFYQKIKKIKLIIFDVDGVLTDGKLYYGNNGEELKVFCVYDGHGIVELKKHGIKTAIISGRKSKALTLRAKDLKIDYFYSGVGSDKTIAFSELLQKSKIHPRQILMMGDDVPDLAVMKQCYLSVAPPTAVKEVLEFVDFTTTAQAGNGAVRELCELFIRK